MDVKYFRIVRKPCYRYYIGRQIFFISIIFANKTHLISIRFEPKLGSDRNILKPI